MLVMKRSVKSSGEAGSPELYTVLNSTSSKDTIVFGGGKHYRVVYKESCSEGAFAPSKKSMHMST